MTSATHLRSLQALELAVRKGSIKAAAAELTITPAAVGQRIKVLEDYLGYELIQRGRTGIRPTEEIRQALAHLNAAFRELNTVSRLLDFQRVNEVHITADTDWAQLWLEPRLVEYKAENPNTHFCVNGVGDVPLRLGDADCEVRMSIAVDSPKSATLYRDYILPVSSPENSDRLVAIPNGEMLEGFPLLHINSDDMGWSEWFNRFGHRRTAPERGIHYDKIVHAMEAVYGGAGFVLCGASLILPQLQSGKLSTPFSIAEGEWAMDPYRVFFRDQSLTRDAVEQFRIWLLDEARDTCTELEELTNA